MLPTIPPVITAPPALRSKKTSTIYTATASDDDGDALTYSLSGTDADDFTIDEDSGEISFSPTPDFENPTDANGDNVYEVNLSVSDGNGNTATQELTFNVTDDTDEAPVITSTNSSTEVEENTASTIYTATASDDDGDALTYSLSGTDADDFTIDEDSGEISFSPTPDFENPTDANGDNVYEVNLSVSDGNGNTATQELTFNVTDDTDEAPVITSTNSSTEVEENTASTIYTATASDDDGDALTYSLSGTDADDFTIDEDSGEISFSPTPDFENPTDANGDNVYEVNLSVSDGNGNTATQELTFNVTDDTDEAPVITSTNSSTEVEENTASTIYTATASDDDGDALTYSLSGTDADDFTIDEDSGEISFSPTPDFENPTDANGDNVYEVNLSVSDGNGNTATQELTFNVTDDTDEAPVITSTNSSTEVEENTASTIYTATASDDDGDALTYSLSGTDADDFTIDEDSGEISFSPTPDFENPTDANGDNVYEVNLSVSDGNGNTATQELTFNVTDDTDEAPVITSTNSSTEVEENTASTIYTATASDDDGDALTYSLSGTDADDFTIDEDSGEISFSPTPDFENPTDANGDNVYEVNLSVSDGNGNTATQELTFNVTDDTDEAPVITSTNSSTEVEENTASTIYTATASDDDGDALTYSLSGTDADDFTIDEDSGEISFSPTPDFENPTDANGDNVYEVNLSVSDGNGNTATQELTFNVTDDTDEAPVITSTNSSTEVEENTASTIYTATASDDDGDALTYSLSGTDADDFTIDEDSGEISFSPTPDFENPTDANGDNVYEVNLSVSDGNGNTATQELTFNVTDDTDEAPVITSTNSSTEVEENTASTIYTATASDDDGDALTYSLSGTDADDFTIDEDSGEISFSPTPDFENPTDANGDNVYEVNLSVSDGNGNTATQELTFNVTDDTDEAPVITSTNSSTEVEENTASTIYTATASDDDGDTLTYSLSGTDADDFTIDEDSGEISFSPTPDFENPTDANGDNVYEVNLSVSDGNGNTATQELTFNVTDDTDEAPVITSTNSSTEVEENTASTIYTATASDDDGDALTYSLSGTDADDFTIDEDSGEISFSPTPDFENPTDANGDNVYEVNLSVSDGNGNTTTQELSFEVTDVNEAPTITSGTSTSVIENTSGTIYTATASDPEGNTLTYELSGTDADDFSINSSSGEISFNPAPDYENPTNAGSNNTYETTLEASDSVNTVTQDLTFTVTNIPDQDAATTSLSLVYSLIDNDIDISFQAETGVLYTLHRSNSENCDLSNSPSTNCANYLSTPLLTNSYSDKINFSATNYYLLVGSANGVNITYDVALDGTQYLDDFQTLQSLNAGYNLTSDEVNIEATDTPNATYTLYIADEQFTYNDNEDDGCADSELSSISTNCANGSSLSDGNMHVATDNALKWNARRFYRLDISDGFSVVHTLEANTSVIDYITLATTNSGSDANLSIDINWTALNSGSIQEYSFYLSDDSSATTATADTWSSLSNARIITGLSSELYNLVPILSQYYVAITATNTAGETTPLSGVYLLNNIVTGAAEPSAWHEIMPNTNSLDVWYGRYSHSTVVFDNKIWIISGAPALNPGDPGSDPIGHSSDVWYSPNGYNWHNATISAEDAGYWGDRFGQSAVVYDAGDGEKIWVMGGIVVDGFTEDGKVESSPAKDIWYSHDGISWTKATDPAWAARAFFPATIFADNLTSATEDDANWDANKRITILGGDKDVSEVNELDGWYADASVTSWSKTTNIGGGDSIPPEAMAQAPSVSVFDDGIDADGRRLWILGGTSDIGDASLSTNAVHATNYLPLSNSWERISADGVAPWKARHWHTTLSYNGDLWLFAGYGGSNVVFDDIWRYHDDDGSYQWQELSNDSYWQQRFGHTSVVFAGRMWIIGGFDGTNYLNDVWASGLEITSFAFNSTTTN